MEEYLKNGQLQETPPTILVNMKDRSSKKFGVNLVDREILTNN